MHDYTKEFSPEKQFELCEFYGIELTEEEKLAPKLLHGKTAAAIASHQFGLPKDACSAIYYHTTGRADMTPFEIVIYLADYIEEFRDDPSCVKLREFYLKNINRNCDKNAVLINTLVRSFDITLKHLIDDGRLIDRNTIGARNFYLRRLAEI
jgi:nicotinate-nucleotide adenylyltransferase